MLKNCVEEIQRKTNASQMALCCDRWKSGQHSYSLYWDAGVTRE